MKSPFVKDTSLGIKPIFRGFSADYSFLGPKRVRKWSIFVDFRTIFGHGFLEKSTPGSSNRVFAVKGCPKRVSKKGCQKPTFGQTRENPPQTAMGLC